MRRLLAAALVLGCAPVVSASASEPDGIGPRAIVATAPGAELGAADHAPGLRLCLDLQVGGEDIDQVCEPRRHRPPSGILLDIGLLRRSSQCGFDLELAPWVTIREPGSSR